MTSLPRARRFDWNNLGVRAASAVVLAAATLGAVWWPHPAPFMILVAVAVSLLSIEWGVMAAPRTPIRVAATMTLAGLAVVFLAYVGRYIEAWGCIGLGALAAAAVSRRGSDRAIDAAYGVLYIGPACLALVWLHAGHETQGWVNQPEGWVTMLFATTWACDIFAFLVGSALKGPKLWPKYSPNKTWSGFFGGLLGAVVAAVTVAALLMRLSLPGAALIGLFGGLATMAGDLWESMLKRRFGVKDSGDLIPGHGGLLDRVDGLMFAVMVFAAARLVVHFGWAH
jgi:phosphatidate cytidylyltransferase